MDHAMPESVSVCCPQAGDRQTERQVLCSSHSGGRQHISHHPQVLNSEINYKRTQFSLLNQLIEMRDPPHATGYLPGMRDPLAIDI